MIMMEGECKVAGIYVLENKTNGKCYVGQTVLMNIFTRTMQHVYSTNLAVDSAIKKYGINSFKVLTYQMPIEFLDYCEIEMIKKTNSLAPNGYNILPGGTSGYRHSEKSKKETRDNNNHTSWNLGNTTPELVRVKQKQGNLGVRRSVKTKERISDGKTGTKYTDEHKRNMSVAHKKRYENIEERKKHSETMKEWWRLRKGHNCEY